MRQIRKIVRDKRGEGYIDVAVMVLCVMLVIALGVRLFPIFITKMQVDNFADELVREAEISGRVGSETSNRQRVLEERTGIHPTVQWSRTGNLQLNEEVTVTVLRLGMIGDEFKTARKFLLENLEGGIAWKNPEQAERQKERLKAKKEKEESNQTAEAENLRLEEESQGMHMTM